LAISKEKKSCTAKAPGEKLCKWSHGEKIEQAFSTIQVLCLTLKKTLAQAIVHQKQSCTTLSENK